MWSRKFKAFTIVEMLVVVAIIAILATIMTISVGNSVVKSRDSKRMADIAMINKAVGLYAAENRQFPEMDSCTTDGTNTTACVQSWEIVQGDGTAGSVIVNQGPPIVWGPGVTTKLISALKTYLPSLPTDPKNQTVAGPPAIYYNYLYSSNQSTYYLRARLEIEDTGNFGTLKTCFGFSGAKNSAVTATLSSWEDFLAGNGPENGCVPGV